MVKGILKGLAVLSNTEILLLCDSFILASFLFFSILLFFLLLMLSPVERKCTPVFQNWGQWLVPFFPTHYSLPAVFRKCGRCFLKHRAVSLLCVTSVIWGQ